MAIGAFIPRIPNRQSKRRVLHVVLVNACGSEDTILKLQLEMERNSMSLELSEIKAPKSA